MSNPKAEIQITAESRTLGAKLREARAQFGKFGAALKKEVFGKVLFDRPKASAHMVGQLGATAVGRGLGILEDQARGVFDFNEALTRLQITASKTPEEMAAFGAQIRNVSTEIGISARDILAGASSYVALTGDAEGATASLRTWARVAQATGSTMSDITQTAAAMKQQLAIRPEEMETAFAAIAAQGKAGAIELKDLAAQLSSIAPQWAEFKGGKGMQGVKELGAMLQMVKRGFGGDAEQTITGLQSLLNAFIKNAGRLQASGVKVFDKDPKTGAKQLRSVFDILDAISNSALAKDPTKIEKALGRVEAYRAILQTWKENRDELHKFVDVAGDAQLIQRDLETYLQSSSGRTATSMEKMKNAIAEAFTPERITAFVTALEGAAEKVGPLLESVGKLASAYGALFNAGRWLAGGTDNANPWKEEGNEARSTERTFQRRGFRDLEDAAAHGVLDKGSAELMRRRIANKDAYDAAVKEIVADGDPDRASPDAIRRAVFLSHGNVNAPGGAGRVVAGERYLSNAHVSRGEADKIFQEALDAQNQRMSAFLEKVTLAIQKGFATSKTEVKADGKAIVDVHRGSSAHARRPGG